MKTEKRFIFEVTNTWRVDVYAKNKTQALKEFKKLSCDGYNKANDYNGLEILYCEEN